MRTARLLMRCHPGEALAALCLLALPGVLAAQTTAHYAGIHSTVANSTTLLSSDPYFLSVDTNANVYISLPDGPTVIVEKPNGNGTYTKSTVKSVLDNLNGLGVDGSGNVYILDENPSTLTDTMYEETPSGSTYTEASGSIVLSSGESTLGIAVDSSANIYMLVSGSSSSRVLKGTLSGSTFTAANVITGLPSTVDAIAVDASDNVYITEASTIVKETLSGGVYSSSTVASGISGSLGLVVDPAGDVYVSDSVNGNVLKETPSGSVYTQTVAAGGFNTAMGPIGVGIDASDNLYVADYNGDGVFRIALGGVNAGLANVNSSHAAISLPFIFDTGGTIGAPVVASQGASALDFIDATTGTCTSNGISHVYSAGDTCTVSVQFSPKLSGTRYGGAILKDNSGNVIATAYVYGAATGPQAAFLPGTQTLVGSGLNAPAGVTVDGSGNVYIADAHNNRVLKEAPSAGSYTQSVIASGLNNPYGMAVDGVGNIYIADVMNSRILKETLSGGGYVQTVIGAGLSGPTGVAVDASGNVYIADFANSRIVKETLYSGTFAQSTIGTGMNNPFGVAVDLAGNVYVADTNNNRVLKETLSNGGYTQSVIASGTITPYGLAVDQFGNVYFCDLGNSVVVEEKVSGSTYVESTLGSGFTEPTGISVDGMGNVYVADGGNTEVTKLDLFDPPSLSFASTYPTIASSDSPKIITLENIGNAVLNFPHDADGNPVISTNFTLDTTVAGACPQVGSVGAAGALAAGSSCTYSLGFLPTTTGNLTGSLAIKDTSLYISDYITQTIALSGTSLVVPTTQTAISGVPPSLASGGNMGTVTVKLEDVNGNVVTIANAPVTLTIAGPYGYAQTLNATASSGIATFNLSSYVLSNGGVYTVTASSPSLTSSSANSTVTDLTGHIVLAASTSTAAQGAPVTFTATATASGSPLHPGQIAFNYTQLVYGIQTTGSFGTGQLTSGGTSALTVQPGAGTYIVTATFAGTGFASAAVSAPLTLTITGSIPYSTASFLAASGSPGNYTLTSTIGEFGLFPPPSGTVSFLNTTAANQSVATSALDPATFGYYLVPAANSPLSPESGSSAYVATGDLNGDGITDLITVIDPYPDTNYTMQVQFGLGNGLFGAATTYAFNTGQLESVTVADVNADGHLDILVNTGSNVVTDKIFVMLNDGTGNFTVPGAGPQLLTAPTGYGVIAVADLNLDGKLDLAVTSGASDTLSVFLGNGDGSFQAPTSYAAGTNPINITTGDFNHDGFPDIVTVNAGSFNLSTFLNNGDGTFQAANSLAFPVPPAGFAVLNSLSAGSLRGNGVVDLVVGDEYSGGLQVYLGNNDGTFASPVAYATRHNAGNTILADINHDGKLDVVAYSFDNSGVDPAYISIFSGNGDGTLAAGEQDYAFGSEPRNFVMADLNNDGLMDFVGVSDSDGTEPILLGVQAVTAIVTGIGVPGPTVQNVDASYSGDSSHAASVSTTVPLLPLPSTLVLSSVPYSATLGTPINIVATIGSTLTTQPSGGTVAFYSGGTLLATVNVSNGTAVYTAASLPAGITSFTAVFSGSATLDGSISAVLHVFVGPQSATTLIVSSNTALVGTPITLTATGINSPAGTPLTPGQVSFTYQQTVNGVTLPGSFGTLQLTSAGTAVLAIEPGAGTYVITAAFAGTTLVGPSVSAAQTVTVTGTGSYVTATTLASSGTSGDYSLLATITGFGLAYPTGMVSFLDTTNANSVVTTALIDPTTASSTLAAASGSPVSAVDVTWVATGDFNNDGIPDVATVHNDGNLIAKLGNGDGTFQAGNSYSYGDPYTQVLVGDVNGDGKQDLIALDSGDTLVDIYYGNGDGTFTPPTSSSQQLTTGNGPSTMATGDFNGDGNLDLAVVNATDNTLTVFLGDGTGTLAPQTAFSIGNGTISIAVADFNADGIADLAMSANTDGSINIYTGVGDGTFVAGSSYQLPDGAPPYNLATGSLRNNGTYDLVVGDPDDYGFFVFLGNNDGTFETNATYIPTENATTYVSLVDIAHNGKLDVVETDGTELGVFLGNGDGTFSATEVDYPTGQGGLNVATADLNHDGLPDFITSDGLDGTITVLLGNTVTTAIANAVYVLGTGTQNVDASYPGDTTHMASLSVTVPLQPSVQSASSTLIAASNTAISVGASVTFTATVQPVPTGPSLGTVSFYTGSTLLGTVPVNASGIAAYSTSALPLGANAITAVFSGNASLAVSTSGVLAESVTYATTSQVSSSVPSSIAGQSITLSASVTPAPTGSSLGTASFYQGTTLLGSSPLGSGGTASLVLTTLPVGTDVITVVYSGSTTYAGSTSGAISINVTAIATSTVLNSSSLTTISEQNVTLTATVTPASTDSARGTVSFYSGTTLLGTGALSAGGIATLNVTTLPAGVDAVTAVYSGSAAYATSTSGAVSIAVTAIATSTSLTASNLSRAAGQSVVLTATLTPASNDTAPGTVNFYSGSTLLGTATVSGAGIATFTTTSLPIGIDSVTAVYSGSPDYATSTSGALSITVVGTATSTVLTSSSLTPTYGQNFVLTATVAPASTDSVRGTVSFYAGGALLGTSPLNTAGLATLSLNSLPAGPAALTAIYAGSATYAGSTSGALSITVAAVTTANALTASSLTPGYGQSVTVTATITPVPSDSARGTVNFYAGTTLLGHQPLGAGGTATLTTSSLPLGTDAVTAVYSGSADYAGSTSTPLAIAALAGTAITFSANPTTQLFNNPIVFTAQVSSSTPGTQTGTVSFLDGTTVVGMAGVANGQATASLSTIPDGSHNITAAYSGDVNFLASASTGTPIAITIADLNLALGDDNNKTVVPGAAVTYNFPLSPLVTPTFLYNVTLTATGLPPGATYTFSPATIPAGSGTLPVAFTVQTAANTAMDSTPANRSTRGGKLFVVAFVLLLPLAGAKSVRKRLQALPGSMAALVLAVLSLGLVSGLVGCGAGGLFSQQKNTFTITISATSGLLVRTSTVQLTLK